MENVVNLLSLIINWAGGLALIVLSWIIYTKKNAPVWLFNNVLRMSTNLVFFFLIGTIVFLLTYPAIIARKMEFQFEAIFTKQQQDHDQAMKEVKDLTEALTQALNDIRKQHEIDQAMFLSEREMTLKELGRPSRR